MGLFGPSLPVDRDEFEWLLACFAWIDRTLGARDGEDGFTPRLVLPGDPDLAAAQTAQALFEAVKHAAGLEQWECRLEKGETRREMINTGMPTGAYSQNSALGTFSVEGNTPVIRYDPALLRQPDALVATFAHELAHLVIHSLDRPPGGEDLEEHATDCMAVYLGFGVFLANSARQFSQFEDGGLQGWQSETAGYLSEGALVTCLAMFERRFGTSADVSDRLKPYLRSSTARRVSISRGISLTSKVRLLRSILRHGDNAGSIPAPSVHSLAQAHHCGPPEGYPYSSRRQAHMVAADTRI